MNSTITQTELKELREFKSEAIELYWEKFGTFYIHIMPHPHLIIGKRGLVGEEKEQGIILVLGPKAIKDYSIDEEFMYCDLQFGYTWEKLTVPWDAIFRIYDKNQNSVTQIRFFTSLLHAIDQKAPKTGKTKKGKAKDTESIDESNVIKIDFGGKKKE